MYHCVASDVLEELGFHFRLSRIMREMEGLASMFSSTASDWPISGLLNVDVLRSQLINCILDEPTHKS
jgi:hypothetical protein